MIRADVVCPDTFDTPQDISFSSWMDLRKDLENIHLYKPMTDYPADSFLEIPTDFDNITFPPSFYRTVRPYIGQAIFAIDFETPAEWQARTGWTIQTS